jgi:hypothetical protein
MLFAALGPIAGAAGGGFLGNRTDTFVCRAIANIAETFSDKAKLPHNHDLFYGLLAAHHKALTHVAQACARFATTPAELNVAEKMTRCIPEKLEAEPKATCAEIAHLVTPLIGSAREGNAETRFQDLVEQGNAAVIAWFNAATQETLPDSFCDIIRHGRSDMQAWHAALQEHLHETIKDQPRYRDIFIASTLAEVLGRQIELSDLIKWHGQQIGERFDRVEARLDKLVAAIESQPQGRAAKAAGIEHRAFVRLARSINLDVDDDTQALAELTRAVEELIALKAEAARGTNLDDLVDAALKRMAAQATEGKFDAAAEEGARAFAQWQQSETERRERERQAGIKLAEATTAQHLLRRNAGDAALWIGGKR